MDLTKKTTKKNSLVNRKQNFSKRVIVFIINVIRGHSLDNIFEIYFTFLINHTYQAMILDLVATPNKHTANK